MGKRTKRRYKISRAQTVVVLEDRLAKVEKRLCLAISVGHLPIIRNLTVRMNNLRAELFYLSGGL